VDATETLRSIARLLPSLPDEPVESLLVTFDALVGVSDDSLRPVEAQLLRDAADASSIPARHDRLLKAADAVADGQPCALTPDGLTAKEAAATQTMTMAEWEEHIARSPLPPPPSPSEPEDDDDEESPCMQEEPPKLPHLTVRRFFPGLVVRVGRDFADAFGRPARTGDLLRLIVCARENDSCALTFVDRIVRLNDSQIVENAGNAWFQPVPTGACLEDLLEAIDLRISESDEDEEDDDQYEARIDRIETIQEEIAACAQWLSISGDRGPAPQCRTGRLAASVFGRDSDLAVWIPLLFAAVAVCLPDL
jgi:hypothetical protein